MEAAPSRLKKLFGYALLVFNVLVVYKAVTNPVIEFDTKRLAGAVPDLVACLSGQTTSCALASYFPPLQQIPALLFHFLGAGFGPVLLLLTWFNVSILMLAQLYLVRTFWRTRIDVVAFFAVATLAGPAMPYLTSSFSESLTLALLVCFVLAFFDARGNVVLFVAAAGLAASKDTAVLWCVLLAAAMYVYQPDARARKSLKVAGGGLALGVLLIVLLNLLRYGSPISTFYSQDAFLVTSFGQAASQFAAILFSPNGGLLYFWLVPLLLLIPMLSSFKPAKGGKWFYLLLGLLAIGVSASLSLFYSPFGWIAWGNRLILTWVFAAAWLIVIARTRNGKSLTEASAENPELFLTRRTKIYVWTAAVCSAVWQLPHAFATAAPAVMMAVFKPTAECPYLVDVLQEKERYTSCLNHYLWPGGWSVLYESWSMVTIGPYEILLYAAAFFLSLTAVAVFLFEQATYQEIQADLQSLQ